MIIARPFYNKCLYILTGIYKITSPSGKINIGQSWDIVDRFKGYKKFRCKSQKLLYRSLIKYGIDNHKFEVLELLPNTTQGHLDEREIYWIRYYKESGYIMMNLQEGGRGGKPSAGSREKMSKSHIGNRLSEETKKKIEEGRNKYLNSKQIYTCIYCGYFNKIKGIVTLFHNDNCPSGGVIQDFKFPEFDNEYKEIFGKYTISKAYRRFCEISDYEKNRYEELKKLEGSNIIVNIGNRVEVKLLFVTTEYEYKRDNYKSFPYEILIEFISNDKRIKSNTMWVKDINRIAIIEVNKLRMQIFNSL